MKLSGIDVHLSEEERQAVLLALAIMVKQRPGWDWFLGQVADRLQGREIFEAFQHISEDNT